MLKIKLYADDKYVLGDTITVIVEYLNQGTKDISVSSPTVGGALKHSIFDVFRYGNKVDYHGMDMKVKEDVMTLVPNDVFKTSVSLNMEYLIDSVGEYTVVLNHNDALLSIDAKRSISFKVISDSARKVAINTWFRLAKSFASFKKKENDKFFDSHIVYGATENQFQELKQAHGKVGITLKYISLHTDSVLPQKFEEHYKNVLGTSNMWPSVFMTYHKMQVYFLDAMKYHFDGSRCTDITYGYVFPSDPEKNIYLCNQYLLAATYPTSDKPYDTKTGVILHELSHKAAGTEDHFYSYEKCNLYAKKGDDEITTENADCIQIFAEYAYLVGERENVHVDL